MFKKISALCIVLCVMTVWCIPAISFADGAKDLKKANESIASAVHSVEDGNVEEARKQFDVFHKTWFSIEEGIKVKSKQAYRDIEEAMGEVQFAFAQDPVNRSSALETLKKLRDANQKFIDGLYRADAAARSGKGASKSNVSDLVSLLDEALAKLDDRDIQDAKEDVEQFRKLWLDIEGIVLTQSAKVYSDAEKDMVLSYSYLSAKPADVNNAKATIQKMRNYLNPLAGKSSYSMLDATTILLREGLEALLVVVALLGFLQKTGHGNKKGWIWLGVGSGILISIILGIIVQMLFAGGAFGSNNFLLAGGAGLFASAMLLYMSYWLHSKSSLASWQRYISNQSTRALATGSLWSLAILSFLAVFREGTETVLFFIGMAASISLFNLLGGIGIGIAVLLVVSYLILKVGLKIPVRPFFMVSSMLVFYLCFKFTGMGVHGLQLAGVLPATHMNAVPTIDVLGVYPTWEGFIPQLTLLLFAIVAIIWNQRKDFKLRKQMTVNTLKTL